MLNNRIGIHTGVGLMRTGYLMTERFDNIRNEHSIEEKWITVPVALHITSSPTKRFSVFGDVGALSGILVKAKRISEYHTSNSLTKTFRSDGLESLNDFSFWPFVRVGLSIRLSKSLTLSFGPTIQYQITNTFEKQFPVQANLITYSFNIGLSAKLRTKEKGKQPKELEEK
jgi:hypothetical protein